MVFNGTPLHYFMERRSSWCRIPCSDNNDDVIISKTHSGNFLWISKKPKIINGFWVFCSCNIWFPRENLFILVNLIWNQCWCGRFFGSFNWKTNRSKDKICQRMETEWKWDLPYIHHERFCSSHGFCAISCIVCWEGGSSSWYWYSVE